MQIYMPCVMNCVDRQGLLEHLVEHLFIQMIWEIERILLYDFRQCAHQLHMDRDHSASRNILLKHFQHYQFPLQVPLHARDKRVCRHWDRSSGWRRISKFYTSMFLNGKKYKSSKPLTQVLYGVLEPFQ